MKLFKSVVIQTKIILLLEPCCRGDLGTLIQKNGRFNDYQSIFIVACAIKGLQHLESLNILYRDLKPENLLLDDDGYVKLSDFGLSKRLMPGEKTKTLVGTAEYLSPEAIKCDGYDSKSTRWCLGILIFELLTGVPPFYENSDNHRNLFNKILNGFRKFEFPKCISGLAQEIILMCCRLKPSLRPSLELLQRFMWFADFAWKDLNNRTLESPLRILKNSDKNHSMYQGF